MAIRLKFSSLLLCVLCACNSSENDALKDMTYPVISGEGVEASPLECQIYYRGDTIPFTYLLTDDTELGAYNIEIHHNFDHHTHSTSATECPMDDSKQAQHAWIFNQDYTIPPSQSSYIAHLDIPIPEDIDSGDYHFMLRVTDRAGWQQLHSVAIKIK